MSTVNANINITVDNKQALGQIRALQAQINSFNKTAAAAGGSAAAQMTALNKALSDAALASGMFGAKIVPTSAHIDRFSDSLDRGKLSLGQYARGVASQMPGARRVFQKEFDTITKVAESRVKALQTQYTALGNAQKALALQPTSLAMGQLATQTAMAAQKQMIMNKMIADGSTKLVNWGKNTQWAGRQLMVGFTMPLTLFGAVAAKVFMDLDKQARDFKRVYGDLFTPPAEIEQNLQAVQKLGEEYTKYGVKVSDTMKVAATAAAAGMRNEKLIAGTEESLRLATIGQIDYNQALDTTISLQTAFKMSADELAPSVDFLGAVANQTVLTIDDMTKAIPRVAPVVKGLGGDVKDLAAMLVAMREGGVSAENAANGLKSGLASLINPTNAARGALSKLGIDIDAIVQANKGDLMGTIMDFGTALSKLGDFERQQALEKTFGKYQYARLGALFDNIIKKGGQAEVALTLAGKSAEELGQLSAKSLSEIEQSTTAKFQGAVERLKVSIAPVGEAFLKALTPIIEFIGKIADKFNNLPDTVKNVAMIMTAAIAGIGPIILMTVGLIANGIGNLIKFFQMIRKGFAKIKGDASAFQYLTTAELEAAAAAASLEGKSEKLTSTLLMQETVVQRLVGLYQRLASSANAAARSMPTMLGARTGGKGGRPPLKMADGGVVPGSGSGDKIPALLEPGETVVTKQASQTYGPVINAMNAGTLPGYRFGRNSERANRGLVFAHGIAPQLFSQSKMDEIKAAMPGNKYIQSATRMQGLSNFGFMTPKAFNQGRMTGQSAAQLFNNPRIVDRTMYPMYKAIADSLGRSTSSVMQDPKIQREVRGFARGIGTELARAGASRINDPAFYAATERALASSRLSPETRSAIEASKRVTTIATYGGEGIRSKGERVGLGRARQERIFRRSATGGSYRSWKGLRSQLPAIAPVSREVSQIMERSGKEAGAVGARAALVEAKRINKAASPAEAYAEVMDDAAKGMVVGAKRSSKIAGSAGTIVAQSARDAYRKEMSQLRRDLRNVDIMQRGGMKDATMQTRTLRRLQEAEARKERARQSEVRAAEQSATLAQRNARLAAQTNAAMQQQSMGMQEQVAAQGGGKMARVGRFFSGGGGMGAGMGLMGVSMMAPMLPGQAGKAAEKMQPALMGLSTLAMMGPMLMNPAGAVVAALAAAAGAVIFFKMKADEMAKNAQKFSDALITGRTATNKIAEFYGTQSLARKTDLKEMKKTAGKGVKTADITQAEEFLKSDAGTSMKEGLSKALQEMGNEGASKQFANNLAAMVLQGVVNPEQARAIATVMGEELGNKTFAIQAVGTLSEIIGPNGEKLSKDPLQVAIEIDQRNSQTLNTMLQTTLPTLQSEFEKTFTSFNPLSAFENFNSMDWWKKAIIGPQTVALMQVASGWDNFVGDVARGGLSWFVPQFEEANTQLLTIGSTIGNSLSQAYDNLSAAKQRYAEISNQAVLVDEKDINAKAEANAAAERAKQQVDALTQSINNQKQALITQLAGDFNLGMPGGGNFGQLGQQPILGRGFTKYSPNASKTIGAKPKSNQLFNTVLSGMEQGLQTAYEENPMQKAALDLIMGNVKDLNPQLRLSITTELASMQLDPLTFQNLMSLYGDNAKTASQVYIDMVARLKGDSRSATEFLQATMQTGFDEAFVKTLNLKTEGMTPEEIKAYTITLQQLSLIDDESLRKRIALSSTGLTEKQLQQQNKGLEIINGLPSEIKKKITIAADSQSALNIGKWYERFKKNPNLTKKIFLETSQYYNALNLARIDYEQFSKLPDIQKSVVITYIEQFQKMDVGSTGADTPAERAAMAAAAAADVETTTPGLTPTDEKGGGGGDKELSGLQELWNNIKEKLRLYTNFTDLMQKYKGQKNAFAKSIKQATYAGSIPDQLRQMNLSESLIADILEKGSKEARRILNALKTRKGLADQMSVADIVGKFGEATNQMVSESKIAQAKVNARGVLRSEKGKGVIENILGKGAQLTADEEQSLLSNEAVVNMINAGKFNKKQFTDFIKGLRELSISESEMKSVDEILQSFIDKKRLQQEVDTYENKQIIKDLQDQLELIDRQIQSIEKKNEKDRQTIRGLERQKEMIQRQIEAIERQNELDQRRIDTLKRQDEIRNRVADSLNHELDIMGQQEQKIREAYDKRTQALEKIRQINEQITKQQQDQLNITRSLAAGDIYEATAAAQQMQQNQIGFAQQQTGQALQQGMENQIAGLRTESGLTRQQAEEQIKSIKEQSYQTSLLIQGIEDKIYERNLQIIPLKDAIYNIDLQIQAVNDQIYNRETEILNIQNNQRDPLLEKLQTEQDILDAKNEQYENEIGTLELAMAREKLAQTEINNANTLASIWRTIADQIADANKTMKRELTEAAGSAPKRQDYETSEDYSNAVTAHQNKLAGIRQRRDAAVAAAMERGKKATAIGGAPETAYAGGYMDKRYAAGNYVLGSGGRDSIPAMLTPGEFIIRKAAVDKYGVPMLNSLNMGAFRTGMPRYNLPDMFAGGTPRFNEANPIQMDAPVYNNYNVNVNVAGTNASADEIATRAIMKIKEMQNMQIRGNRAY